MKARYGFIGLGIMGAPMAERLLARGAQLFVTNRTKEKATELCQRGAIWADSPADVAEHSDIVFTMLSTPEVLEHIAVGEKGVLKGLKKTSVHVDCSTVSPALTERLQKMYEKEGCSFYHAPVLGGVAQIQEGSLLTFLGGTGYRFEEVHTALRSWSGRIWHFENIRQATLLKLMSNSIIAGLISSLVQALVVGAKGGIAPETFLEVLSFSQLNAPTFQKKGKAILERDFAPRFFIDHLLKDINLMLGVAEELGVPMPVLEAIQKLFREAQEKGLGREDYAAVVKVLEGKAGVLVQGGSGKVTAAH